MKPFIRKSAVAAALAIAIIASSFQTDAQGDKLVYDRAHNTSIGITVENAVGADYSIKDKNSNIVLQGKVSSTKTFYIPTAKFNTGSYRFFIGSMAIQEFSIK